MTRAGPPLIPEVGILAMPYHRFGTRWMTPHHLMNHLATYFSVLWLEPPHHWREGQQLSPRRGEVQRLLRTLPQGFDVYIPERWLFDIYRPAWVRHRLFEARLARAWQRLRSRGARTMVLHLWHYQFEAALQTAGHDLALYHIDDEYSFSPISLPMDPAEHRVIAGVDQVFAVSPRLMERKGGINPRLTFAPEGVDFALYSTAVPEPADLAGIPHPRIGYTGTLKVQLDWSLLRELVRRHPGWSFVFVGPKALNPEMGALVAEFERFPNVHLLGFKPVRDLAAYPQHFDVCTMPYLVDDYTDNIYPLKLHEYLASGKPVVATPIRTLRDFDRVVTLAGSLDEWSDALTRSLGTAARSPDAIATRRAVARQYDWSELTYNIARIVCERLDPSYLARLSKLVVETPVLLP